MKNKPKPLHMWANYYSDDAMPHLHRQKGDAYAFAHPDDATVRVAVIPLDDEREMLKKAMQAYADCPTTAFKDAMRAALEAIGVLPKQRKGRK